MNLVLIIRRNNYITFMENTFKLPECEIGIGESAIDAINKYVTETLQIKVSDIEYVRTESVTSKIYGTYTNHVYTAKFEELITPKAPIVFVEHWRSRKEISDRDIAYIVEAYALP